MPKKPPKRTWDKPKELINVRKSKYEWDSRANKDYWKDVFKNLEEEAEYECPDMQLGRILEVVPPRAYNKVADMLNLPDAFELGRRKYTPLGLKQAPSVEFYGKTVASKDAAGKTKEAKEVTSEDLLKMWNSNDSIKSPLETSEDAQTKSFSRSYTKSTALSKSSASYVKTPASPSPGEDKEIRVQYYKEDYQEETNSADDMEVLLPTREKKLKSNPHYELLKTDKSDHQMCSWPSKLFPKKISEREQLGEKADRITDEISQRFIDWYQGLGASRSEIINLKTLKVLFQVEFDEHASRALSVIVRQLPCISPQIAEVTKEKSMSCKARLERCLKADLAAELKPTQQTAFNRSLPPELRHIQVRNNVYENWIKLKTVPKGLESLETVWSGITHLRSTKQYYEWLQENHKKVPTYLKKHYEYEKAHPPLIDESSSIAPEDETELILGISRVPEHDLEAMKVKALEEVD